MTRPHEAHFEQLSERWLEGDDASLEPLRAIAASDPALALELRLMEQERASDREPASADDAALLERVMHRPVERTATRSLLPRVAAVALALFVLTGTAAAAYWAGQRAGRAPASAAPAQPNSTPTKRAPAPVATERAQAEESVAAVSAPPAVAVSRDAAVTTASPSNDHRPAASAARLFERARQQRGAGHFTQAARTYRELLRRYPASAEAATSRLSLARLLLTRLSDAQGALRQLDAYLRRSPRGSLAPECRYQRAVALRRLGRRQQEERALRQSLERDPHSVYASAVRRRLEQLLVDSVGAPASPRGQ